MRIVRTSLLNALESIAPGIASREMIEQGTCAVFMEGKVCSYNDEIFCEYTLDDGLNINGAVPMAPLRSILHKMKEEEVEVSVAGGEFLVKGKSGRESGIRIDPVVTLPISKVEKPEKFKRLPESFAAAVARVTACASNDSGKYNITCVHMTASHIEATDNNQAIRYAMKLPVSDPALVRATSLAQIKLAMPKSVGFTKSWVHFKNDLGLRMSIRKDAAGTHKFPALDKYIAFTGKDIVLPKSLSEACDRAEVFSAEDAETNMVKVEIVSGRSMTLTGEGSLGWYKERKKIDYKGPDLLFMISPVLLAALVQEGHPCRVDGQRLVMEGANFSYVVALEAPAATLPEEPTDDSDE